MSKLTIHEAKPHLSRYLKHLEAGETILLCKHNVPLAEIRPLPQSRTTPHWSQLRGRYRFFVVPPRVWVPSPRWGEGQDEGHETENAFWVPLTLALSPLGEGIAERAFRKMS
jgi:antitoxin (DNA-binding transcriptional repressor) of toxin-antitoxin stability system